MQISAEKSVKYFSFVSEMACFGGEWRINSGIKMQKEDTHLSASSSCFGLNSKPLSQQQEELLES